MLPLRLKAAVTTPPTSTTTTPTPTTITISKSLEGLETTSVQPHEMSRLFISQ